MALESIAKFPNTSIGGILIDACLSETHTLASDVTEYPVEEGSAITDHARAKPNHVSLECIITNTPLSETARREAEITQGDLGIGRATDIFRRLEIMQATSQVLQVVTPLKVYDDMLIESLTVPRDPRTGDAIRFQIAFKQVRLVRNKVVFVRPAVKRAGKKLRLVAGDAVITNSPTEKAAVAVKHRSALVGGRDDGAWAGLSQLGTNAGL